MNPFLHNSEEALMKTLTAQGTLPQVLDRRALRCLAAHAGEPSILRALAGTPEDTYSERLLSKDYNHIPVNHLLTLVTRIGRFLRKDDDTLVRAYNAAYLSLEKFDPNHRIRDITLTMMSYPNVGQLEETGAIGKPNPDRLPHIQAMYLGFEVFTIGRNPGGFSPSPDYHSIRFARGSHTPTFTAEECQELAHLTLASVLQLAAQDMVVNGFTKTFPLGGEETALIPYTEVHDTLSQKMGQGHFRLWIGGTRVGIRTELPDGNEVALPHGDMNVTSWYTEGLRHRHYPFAYLDPKTDMEHTVEAPDVEAIETLERLWAMTEQARTLPTLPGIAMDADLRHQGDVELQQIFREIRQVGQALIFTTDDEGQQRVNMKNLESINMRKALIVDVGHHQQGGGLTATVVDSRQDVRHSLTIQ